MPEVTAIFIDDVGVMNDNALRGPEWQRLVAEYFAPRLGGDHATWAEANRVVFKRLEPFIIAGPGEQEYTAWHHTYWLLWLREMAAFVGVPMPEDDAQCLEIAWQSNDYVTERIHSTYPGATEAIHLLHRKGFILFTASGEHSRELEGYLKGMGIRSLFHTLYGPDIINYGKRSVEYYRRIFNHTGVIPNQALVVDDYPYALVWAASLGAKTCLVSPNLHQDAGVDLIISSLGNLPSALEK